MKEDKNSFLNLQIKFGISILIIGTVWWLTSGLEVGLKQILVVQKVGIETQWNAGKHAPFVIMLFGAILGIFGVLKNFIPKQNINNE